MRHFSGFRSRAITTVSLLILINLGTWAVALWALAEEPGVAHVVGLRLARSDHAPHAGEYREDGEELDHPSGVGIAARPLYGWEPRNAYLARANNCDRPGAASRRVQVGWPRGATPASRTRPTGRRRRGRCSP